MRNATELNYRILNRCLGAGRPENRVTAISKAPQKKCIGLTFTDEPGTKLCHVLCRIAPKCARLVAHILHHRCMFLIILEWSPILHFGRSIAWSTGIENKPVNY